MHFASFCLKNQAV